MKIGRFALVLPVSLLVLTGCGGGGEGMAMVMCETLIDQRVGMELEHRGPMDGATVEGDGPYVVRSGFVEPATRRTTNYVCTVERVGDDQWRLVDLVTDR